MRLRILTAAALMMGQLAHAQSDMAASSSIGFTSSDSSLTASFRWAKQEALSYVHPDSPIGPWFEAALPGRNAFCMRDVSHQTEGAAALGFLDANHNMLKRFAASVAKSRDWAAYWEITGEGKPSPEDYLSDNDFWFNLPANFDVLDASVRMMRWSGDASYRTDPVFQKFDDVTMKQYLHAWQLTPDLILQRPRIANQRLDKGRFVSARGIPSYSEGTKDFVVGTDLLASEYRAMLSFQELAFSPSDQEAARRGAAAIQAVLERVSWSEKGHHYYGMIRPDLTGYGSGDTMVLYFGASKNPERIRGALDFIASPTYWKQINIEEESYVALILFRYGRVATAYEVLADISSATKQRREYPEVSFSVVNAIVSGTMGLTPAANAASYDIATLSRPAHEADEATLTDVTIRSNRITVIHQGTKLTRLKNIAGPSFRWRAEFQGTFRRVWVGKQNVPAEHGITPEGLPISWIDLTIPAGQEVEVHRD